MNANDSDADDLSLRIRKMLEELHEFGEAALILVSVKNDEGWVQLYHDCSGNLHTILGMTNHYLEVKRHQRLLDDLAHRAQHPEEDEEEE